MTRRLTPPKPFGCRGAPPSFALGMRPYADELDIRNAFRTSLDEGLAGVLALGDRHHVKPSTRLYGGRARQMDREWWVECAFARLLEISVLPMSVVLTALGGPLMCRGAHPAAQLFAKTVGVLIHRRIMSRYRSINRSHIVSCDNRVYFPAGGSEQLSKLTEQSPVYDALNYCLAKQRCDIIDIDVREMWEIKPASLASSATLQLWGYLDNYEIARMLAKYRRDTIPPPISRGDPRKLDKRILEKFDIQLNPVMGLALEVTPIVAQQLPGLILYTVRLKSTRNRSRQQAQKALLDGDVTMQRFLIAARREAEIVYAAETRRDLQVSCAVTAVTAAVAVAALTAGLLAPEAAVGAGAAAEELLPVAAAEGGAEVISLAEAAASGAEGRAAMALLPELTKIAAGLATVYLADRTFRLPPEVVGIGIQSGHATGENLTQLIE